MHSLRRKKHGGNASFAVGCCCAGSGTDIRRAMNLADEQMYADKERYYAKYPERRTRV